eukprot:5547210-Prymnesium_polylepis.2
MCIRDRSGPVFQPGLNLVHVLVVAVHRHLREAPWVALVQAHLIQRVHRLARELLEQLEVVEADTEPAHPVRLEAVLAPLDQLPHLADRRTGFAAIMPM